MRLSKLVRIIAIAAALGLLAASCGDDGGSPSGDTSGDDSGTVSDDTSGGDTADDASSDDGSDDGSDADDRSAELVGTWDIVAFQLAGAEGEAEPTGAPTITFAADGTIAFDTGCNTGEGEYETGFPYFAPDDDAGLVGQVIAFDGLARTEIACEPDFDDQDLAIPGAIRAATLFEFIDGNLALWRDGNIMIAAEPATP